VVALRGVEARADERGKGNVSLQTLKILADALKVLIVDLRARFGHDPRDC
jgi:hypothetical protein